MVNDGSEYHWWIHGYEIERWFLLFDKVPGGFFGEGFGCSVAVGWIGGGFFGGDAVPVFFGIGVAWPHAAGFFYVYDGGEGGGYDLFFSSEISCSRFSYCYGAVLRVLVQRVIDVASKEPIGFRYLASRSISMNVWRFENHKSPESHPHQS